MFQVMFYANWLWYKTQCHILMEYRHILMILYLIQMNESLFLLSLCTFDCTRLCIFIFGFRTISIEKRHTLADPPNIFEILEKVYRVNERKRSLKINAVKITMKNGSVHLKNYNR